LAWLTLKKLFNGTEDPEAESERGETFSKRDLLKRDTLTFKKKESINFIKTKQKCLRSLEKTNRVKHNKPP